jgi:hypothetical protein
VFDYFHKLDLLLQDNAQKMTLDNREVDKILSASNIPIRHALENILHLTLQGRELAIFRAFCSDYSKNLELRERLWDHPSYHLLQKTVFGALRELHKMAIAWTSYGFLCSVPMETMVGDRIVLPWGCSNPMVLRPSDTGSWHRLIGFASVFMWREIELVPMLVRCGVQKVENFTIK